MIVTYGAQNFLSDVLNVSPYLIRMYIICAACNGYRPLQLLHVSGGSFGHSYICRRCHPSLCVMDFDGPFLPICSIPIQKDMCPSCGKIYLVYIFFTARKGEQTCSSVIYDQKENIVREKKVLWYGYIFFL
jgi:hypothetical protein